MEKCQEIKQMRSLLEDKHKEHTRVRLREPAGGELPKPLSA
jgi:hypothetical protein